MVNTRCDDIPKRAYAEQHGCTKRENVTWFVPLSHLHAKLDGPSLVHLVGPVLLKKLAHVVAVVSTNRVSLPGRVGASRVRLQTTTIKAEKNVDHRDVARFEGGGGGLSTYFASFGKLRRIKNKTDRPRQWSSDRLLVMELSFFFFLQDVDIMVAR